MRDADTAPRGTFREVVAESEDGGQRLDRLLSLRLPDLSRARIQALIRAGHVSRAGVTIGEAGLRVKPGERFSVEIPPTAPAEPAPEAIPLTVVYEDAHLIVIDKPAGLVVHPAAGHAGGTLVNALLAHCGDSLSGIGGVARPGIVHRLDKDTSGLLVVAKTDAAHSGLSEQFAAHGRDGRLERTYLAIVWGVPERQTGRVEARLGRSHGDRTRISVVKGDAGRHAVTRYNVRRKYLDRRGKAVAALLELELETGRTHQIRVHLGHIGHPVMGDPVYARGFKSSAARLTPEAGDALAGLGRQALHAHRLGFEHPVTGKRLRFESELPPDMARLAAALSG